MNSVSTILAKKYAQAFVRYYGVHRSSLGPLSELLDFFENNKKILFFLSLEHKKHKVIVDFLIAMRTAISLDPSYDELVRLLIAHKRLSLLPKVIQQILVLQYDQLGIEEFKVVTTIPLTEKQRELVRMFLLKKRACNDVVMHYTYNKKLIAGIRLQSTTAVWEYSIDKQLRRMRTSLT